MNQIFENIFIKQAIFNNIVSIERNKKPAFTHYLIVGPMNLGCF